MDNENKLKELFKRYNHRLLYILLIMLILFSVVIRAPKADKQNFYNADATYHVLLTMKAYDETPISVHKFVPIVSLGSIEDKDISWGATIKDKFGNFYYTSFSAAGFVAPYLFVKVFHLPINENSLYIFNTFLYVLSFVFSYKLFKNIFQTRLAKQYILIVVFLIYLFQPEIMHSQGIVYWHHSIFQLVFLIQLNMFLDIENKTKAILFFLLCLVAPYIEWTGYISNLGFAIAFLFNNKTYFRKDEITIKRESIYNFGRISILTILSFASFSLHFVSVVSKYDYAKALYLRFFARSGMGGGIITSKRIYNFVWNIDYNNQHFNHYGFI